MPRIRIPKDRALEIQVPASFFSLPLLDKTPSDRIRRMLSSNALIPLTPANTANLLKELTA